MAKKYYELPVEQWNVRHFHDYMGDLHTKLFGIAYQPGGGGWRTEQGLLGDVVGTQKKPARYDKALIKEFITRSFEGYTPSATHPGTNFMFIWSFRKNVLQQVELEFARKQKAAEATTVDDLDEEWF